MAESQKKIVLVTNPDKPDVRKVAWGLLDWLKGQVEIVGHNLEEDLDYANLEGVDFVVVLGGDGTLLHAVRQSGDSQIPVIGVNMGKLGFLAEYSMTQFKSYLDQILSDRKLISKRIMLNCRVEGPNRDPFNTIVVNELAIIAGPPFRMLEVAVSMAGEPLAVCLGDGLIISTPTGSTAYNLSAGGPIMDPVLDAVVVTPLAAHSLSFRPVVVNLNEAIVLRATNSRLEPVETVEDGRRGGASAVMVVDGQDYLPLSSEDTIEITRSEAMFQLVRHPKQSQWSLLNAKLHWGSIPKYEYASRNHE